LKQFKIIAVTHRDVDVEKIGMFHIGDDDLEARLQNLKKACNLSGLMYLSTCNRVEFVLSTEVDITPLFLINFFSNFNPLWSAEEVKWAADVCNSFEGEVAVEHLFKVASSIDSMVVGEREIITQVRKAFDLSRDLGISDDTIRVVIRQTIETAKQVFTETTIATKPVSVVSLAYHELKKQHVSLDARILIVGAGVTNNNMSRFLKKHGFTNFHVFNRTLSKAEKLANDISGKAYSLDELKKYMDGFDVIITCTGAPDHIIGLDLYQQLLQKETDQKIVIDLSVPSDLNPIVVDHHKVNHISVSHLQVISEANMKERAKEIGQVEHILNSRLVEFNKIYRLRQIERAMGAVPQKVKEIKSHAINNVFANDLENLDDNSKEVLLKMMNFMEKKYMSIPMLMAKEILLEENKSWEN
jgi:glutamyl-tRNA reductase